MVSLPFEWSVAVAADRLSKGGIMVSAPRAQRLDEGKLREMDAAHEMLAFLAWNVRVKLVMLMACEPADVTRLAERSGFPVCTVCRHLGAMREMGLVTVTPVRNRRVHGLAEHVKVERTHARVRVRIGVGAGSELSFDVRMQPEPVAAAPAVVTRGLKATRKKAAVNQDAGERLTATAL